MTAGHQTAGQPSGDRPPTGPGTDSGDEALHLDRAAFGYDGRPIVSDITLHVRRGESLALLGPNGCGKSTLVKGLLGLDEHLGGAVRVLGSPLAALRRRSRIGYVPQRHTLSTSVVATVEEIVMIGRLPHLGPLRRPGRADHEIVHHALDLVGLGDRGTDDVTHLSGGQQRRVLVARALAGQPEILVMDEPTAGVDESNQAVLAGTMRTLADGGVTLLTVTHELEALAPAIDRVVRMTGGRIVADDPVTAYLDADGRALASQPGAAHAHGCGHGDHHLPPPTPPGVHLRTHHLREDTDA